MHLLGYEEAAGLGLGGVRVPQGQLVGHQTEGVVPHLPLAPLCTTDPAEHGLLLSAVAYGVYADTHKTTKLFKHQLNL